MANIPFSDVTLIAAGLGTFFLIVAFYKSVFHKRPPLEHTAKPSVEEPSKPSDDSLVKLTDPFQQVPVDSLPPAAAAAKASDDFYPKLTPTATAGVSAFRRYNPIAGVNSEPAPSAGDAVYEWE